MRVLSVIVQAFAFGVFLVTVLAVIVFLWAFSAPAR
jgi:hypothetical protein